MIGIIKRLALILFCLVLFLAAFLFYSIRRSFPQIDGEVRLNGLNAGVQVIRDQYGVPHIYAENRDDLFRAQGYVHAQERFWQMDFWRHTGKGELSELFGKSQLETDRFLRMMGWARTAQEEVKQLDEISRTILQAYSEGVNAYLADRQGTRLSLEYGILKLTNREYKPEPWTPLDSLVWGKVMSWDLGMNLSTESSRARLLKYINAKQIDELYPPYPSMNPLVLPDFHSMQSNAQAEAVDFSPQSTQSAQRKKEFSSKLRVLSVLGSEFSTASAWIPSNLPIEDLLENFPVGNNGDSGIGSNNWVISGDRTKTGKPLLANDPHLQAQMPNIWFQIHLQCSPENEDCRFNVSGFSMAGVPGVIIGHNQRIAWGFTNVAPDVMDLYVEKLNPQNPDQYEVNGSWIDMKQIHEEITVSGGKPEPVRIRYTRHGPVISDFSKSAKEITRTKTATMPQQYELALRWTALDRSTTFPAIWQMNLAKNWQDFRTAASHFDVPSQNIVYADVDGNIGYQFPGKVPVRRKGDGTYPVPGWTDEYEWTGFIPFQDLPYDFNPASGYIASANNAVVADNHRHFITKDWDYGWRAKRIVEMIESQTNPIDSEFMKKMQADNKNYNASHLVPALMRIPLQDPHLTQVRNLLGNWDYHQNADSIPAALFETFWRKLLEEVFHDDLPASFRPTGGSRWIEVIRLLLQQPENRWWDNRKTSAVERRDDVLIEAFRKAVHELEEQAGKNPADWRWGDLHTVTFRNGSFGQSGIKIMEWFFNRGPFPTGGGSSVVNATSWNAAADSYEVTALPSMRMIVDLSDFDQSYAIHTTGQSGHAFHPHYIDMAEPWRKMQYHPMLWTRSSIESNAEGTLQLIP